MSEKPNKSEAEKEKYNSLTLNEKMSEIRKKRTEIGKKRTESGENDKKENYYPLFWDYLQDARKSDKE